MAKARIKVETWAYPGWKDLRIKEVECHVTPKRVTVGKGGGKQVFDRATGKEIARWYSGKHYLYTLIEVMDGA
jgi:hypothetical protein